MAIGSHEARPRRIDSRGWVIIVLVLIPLTIAYLLINRHYRSQVVIGAAASKLLLTEVLSRYNEQIYEQHEAARAGGKIDHGPIRNLLVKSTNVKGSDNNLIGRIEVVIFRDPPRQDRYVYCFRIRHAPEPGWALQWDVSRLDYYFY